MSKLDHIGIPVSNFEASLAFYEAALAPLGVTTMMKFDGAAGLGSGEPFLWVSTGTVGGTVHLALSAANRAEVDAFYAAAIKAGGKDNGGPGLRPHYHPNYYAAFVFDPDGHNIEAVCHLPE